MSSGFLNLGHKYEGKLSDEVRMYKILMNSGRKGWWTIYTEMEYCSTPYIFFEWA